MSVFFLSIQGVARDSPAPLLAPPLTRGVARRAELTSAQKASEYLAQGGGGGREVAQLRDALGGTKLNNMENKQMAEASKAVLALSDKLNAGGVSESVCSSLKEMGEHGGVGVDAD